MIQANELRIGNYFIDFENSIFKWDLDHFDLMINHVADIDEIIKSPIPITEEWLLKFDFTQSPAFKSLYFIGTFLNITLGTKIMFEINDQIIGEIKYVHQLQNLYFALTQTELPYE